MKTGTWDDEAENWVRWARTPNHDVFSYFAPSFFTDIVPPARGRTLEIGCGEGRVARDWPRDRTTSWRSTLRRRSPDSLAMPTCRLPTSSPTARRSHSQTRRSRPSSPINSLQTTEAVTDMARIVREAARVLTSRGHLCLCVAHPMTDVDRGKGPSATGDVTISGSYFEHERVDETVTKDGLEMTFRGWTHTLEGYARAIEEAGLLIDRIREPVPSETDIEARPSLAAWRRVPLFLFMRAVKG